MRIATVKSWLLAALSLASPAASQGEVARGPFEFNAYYGFTTQSDPELNGAAIIKLGDSAPTFRWSTREGVSVHTVYLDELDTAATEKKIGYGVAGTSGDLGMEGPGLANVPKTLNVTSNTLEGTVSIPLNQSQDLAAWDGATRSVKSLYFEAHWSKDGEEHISYSRLFTLVSEVPDMITKALENSGFKDDQPFIPKDNADEENHTATRSDDPTPSSSITSTSTAQPTTTDNTSGTEKPTSSKGKKGLSIGAIVGIAIACGLLGLALVGGIVFFCVRRRQKQNALGGGTSRGVPYGGFASGGGRNGGDELMAEKEANAGVIHDVTSAPHSPYSDDGHSHQQHLMGMGGAGANNRNSGSDVIPNIGSGVSPHVVLPGVDGRLEGDGGSPVSNAPSHHMQQQQQIQHDHQSGRSYTMYSDHQSGGGGGGSPTTLHSGGGAPSLTHGGGAGTESNRGSLISQQQQGRSLSTPYAHLVEEGMTEEEIRRLEEEERQLDAAIEQHAGGRRGSRNL